MICQTIAYKIIKECLCYTDPRNLSHLGNLRNAKLVTYQLEIWIIKYEIFTVHLQQIIWYYANIEYCGD